MTSKLLLAASLAAFASLAVRAETLSVAVSANMMPAMEQIKRRFRAETGVDLVLTPGSSGKFAAQIRNGAPFDLFVSADARLPDALVAAGFAHGPAARYARGSLVLWSARGADVSSLQALLDPKTKRIAVADPRLAPYGRAAIQALESAGVHERLRKKLVYGESVSQVNQFVASKAAEAGLTARSSVASAPWRDVGAWTAVDPSLHDPIEQALIVTRAGARRAPASTRRLRDWMLGPAGRAILQTHGYGAP